MFYDILFWTYLAAILFACICSIKRFNILDRPSRILTALVCCAFVNESIAFYLAKKYHNNVPLYNIYCFIEFTFLCIYFDNLIDVFIKKKVGIYVCIAGVILGILNLSFVQHLNTINSYFLFLEGLLVIGMSLFAFFRLLLKHDSLHFYRYHHFWFLSALIFFWSITFLNWGLYDYINMNFKEASWMTNYTLTIASIITYTSIGIVFLYYPKMQKGND